MSLTCGFCYIRNALHEITEETLAECSGLAMPLSEIIDKNMEKLRKRYPSGFDVERSKNREVKE